MIANIDRIALQAKLNSSRRPILAEALPEKYFRDAHLPGAIHLPHDAVDALAPERLPDRGADIVVYCANRNSAIRACRYTRTASRTGWRRDCHWNGKRRWSNEGTDPSGRGPLRDEAIQAARNSGPCLSSRPERPSISPYSTS
jgi:rhodanese-related sulfurtransferase